MLRLSSLSLIALTLVLVACGGGGDGPGAASPSGGAKHALKDNPAPDVAGDSLNGQGHVSLPKWKGKVVLVDFWATWCEPCKKSFPAIEALRVKYGASGLEIVGISEDDEPAGVKGFGDKFGAKFPLVWDKDKSMAGKWHPDTMPSTFIVDKQGVVRFVHIGYHDDEKEIETEVKSLL